MKYKWHIIKILIIVLFAFIIYFYSPANQKKIERRKMHDSQLRIATNELKQAFAVLIQSAFEHNLSEKPFDIQTEVRNISGNKNIGVNLFLINENPTNWARINPDSTVWKFNANNITNSDDIAMYCKINIPIKNLKEYLAITFSGDFTLLTNKPIWQPIFININVNDAVNEEEMGSHLNN